jgi:hypothetical protein
LRDVCIMVDETPPPSFFAEAANMDTPPERLTELVRYAVLQPLIATNPATPPDTLEQLREANDPAIRRAIVQNPNAYVTTLGRLASEFPQEFLRNPIVPILNMTRPRFIMEFPPAAWISLLRFENIPLSWLQHIKTDRSYQRGQPGVWKLVQLHVSQTGDTHKAWRAEADSELKEYRQKPPQSAAIDPQDDVDTFLLFVLLFPQYVSMLKEQWANAARTSPRKTGAVLSTSIEMSRKTMSVLSFERSCFILCQVARHRCTSEKALARLAARSMPEVRRAVASNARTPLENLYILMADKNHTVRRVVATHPALLPEDHEILALDEDSTVRAALATLPRLKYELLIQLASDPAAVVRAAVARNVKVSMDLLAVLAQDADPMVRAAAAGNPRLPGKIQLTLLTDPETAVRASLSGNASLLEQCYAALAQDPSLTVRKYLAANPRTPTSLLEALWHTGDGEVWQGIAHHPQVAPALLAQLAQQGDVRVRAAVAAHKRTPVEVLRTLAQENTREIWYGLVANPHAPLDILERALATPYSELCYRLVNHPTIVREQRRPLVTLLARKIQSLIAANRLPDWLRRVVFQYYTALPASIVEMFANSLYWEERYLAARHPHMAESVLNALAHDGICYVQAAAHDALQRRQHSRDRQR